MKVLIVDKLSPETVTALEKLNLKSRCGAISTPTTCPGAGRRGHPGRPLHQGDGRGDPGGAATLADYPRRGGRRHHRPGRRQRAGHLRGQLPRQEHRGRGRTGHRAADRRRPADRRCDRRPAQRRLAEEGVWQGPRTGRPHAGHPRLRRHRQGGGPARRRAGNDGDRLVAASLTPATAEEQGVGYAASPEELAAAADAVSIHLALDARDKAPGRQEAFSTP